MNHFIKISEATAARYLGTNLQQPPPRYLALPGWDSLHIFNSTESTWVAAIDELGLNK